MFDGDGVLGMGLWEARDGILNMTENIHSLQVRGLNAQTSGYNLLTTISELETCISGTNDVCDYLVDNVKN